MPLVRVIACGTPDAGDDAAGLAAVRAVGRELAAIPGVEVVESASPLDVVHLLEGADAVVVVDAVREPLVDDWWEHFQADGAAAGVMITARRSDAEDLNARARTRLASAGALTGPALLVGSSMGAWIMLLAALVLRPLPPEVVARYGPPPGGGRPSPQHRLATAPVVPPARTSATGVASAAVAAPVDSIARPMPKAAPITSRTSPRSNRPTPSARSRTTPTKRPRKTTRRSRSTRRGEPCGTGRRRGWI